MTTIKVDERTKAGKVLLEMARLVAKEKKGVEVVEETPYDMKFVKELKRREKEAQGKELTKINPDDIWGSIL